MTFKSELQRRHFWAKHIKRAKARSKDKKAPDEESVEAPVEEAATLDRAGKFTAAGMVAGGLTGGIAGYKRAKKKNKSKLLGALKGVSSGGALGGGAGGALSGVGRAERKRRLTNAAKHFNDKDAQKLEYFIKSRKNDVNEDNVKNLRKKVKQSTDFIKTATRKFAKHSTTGQKVAAASIAGGAALGALKRGKRTWDFEKGEPGRKSKTVKGAAKGAFSGAITGSIVGLPLGRTVDYMKVEDAANQLLAGTDVTKVLSQLLIERKEITPLSSINPRAARWMGRHKKLQALALSNLKGNIPVVSALFRKGRVKRYRAALFKKHKAEIDREARPAVAAVNRHKDEIEEYINTLQSGYRASHTPEAAYKSLTKQLVRDKKKLFANDSNADVANWSSFELENLAIWLIQEAVNYTIWLKEPFIELFSLMLAAVYADYVYNKYEEDKSKYVY